MKAIGYIRVSTSDQARHGVSLAEQRNAIVKRAESSGWELVQIFEDAGSSGGKWESRPALQDALAAIANRKTDTFIFTKIDRLSRSTMDLLQFHNSLSKYRRADGGRGIELVCIEQDIDTTTPAGKMMFTMQAGFAELEREMIRERTSRGLQELKRQGKCTGMEPYGYRKDAEGYLEPYPQEQVALAVIKILIDSRFSYNIIRDCMNDLGFRSRRGKQWSTTGVHRTAQTHGLATGAMPIFRYYRLNKGAASLATGKVRGEDERAPILVCAPEMGHTQFQKDRKEPAGLVHGHDCLANGTIDLERLLERAVNLQQRLAVIDQVYIPMDRREELDLPPIAPEPAWDLGLKLLAPV